ncbi:hypothetical protein GIB67_019446 [Kingdonia uniflora]|uniref:Uncharacterized protein n=1 Tax=Kingdonia uniflora TaxID=39325 RepID=A0A7J7MUB0_9MAGN|nr:hypothetical protein GIB67_019446 [Kingdonia uniflora]
MSLRPRTTTTIKTITAQETTRSSEITEQEIEIRKPAPVTSLPQRAITQTLASTAHLANLLPTGTLLAFQILTPTFTNNGTCDAVTRPLTQILLMLLAVSCFLASFTDSFRSPDGQIYYGLATFRGMWLFDYQTTGSTLPEFSKYRLRFIDYVHAVLSVFVFVAIALRDSNVLNCFYPHPGNEAQEFFNIVPLGIGLVCSLMFVVFPTRRHGIGYPVSSGN